MFKNETMREIIIHDEKNNQQNKCKYCGIMLIIYLIMLFIAGAIGFTIIFNLKNEIEKVQTNMNINNKNISMILKEIEDKNKNFVDYTSFKDQIDKIKLQIQIQNNDLKEQIFKNISLKLKEKEDKIDKDITSFKAQIEEIKLQMQIQNNDLKEQIFKNISMKLKEMEDKIDEDNSSLRKQINEIIIQNNDLKQQISQKDIKIQNGEYGLDFFNTDYEYMFNSSDWRTFSQHIYFEEKYERPPKVLVFFNKLDSAKDNNLRYSIYSSNIDTSGFDLNIQTWDDSCIYGFRIIWISFLN